MLAPEEILGIDAHVIELAREVRAAPGSADARHAVADKVADLACAQPEAVTVRRLG